MMLKTCNKAPGNQWP